MLASGTGIAPMLPIIQYITENEDDETFVTLVGCFRTFENMYMKTLLQEQSRFWNIRTFYVLSQVNICLGNGPFVLLRQSLHLIILWALQVVDDEFMTILQSQCNWIVA